MSIQNYLMSAVKVALSVLEVILSELQDCHTYKVSDLELVMDSYNIPNILVGNLFWLIGGFC